MATSKKMGHQIYELHHASGCCCLCESFARTLNFQGTLRKQSNEENFNDCVCFESRSARLHPGALDLGKHIEGVGCPVIMRQDRLYS